MAAWSLGIDIGTAYTKLVGLDAHGLPVLVASVSTPRWLASGEGAQATAQLLAGLLESAQAPALHQARISTCVQSRFVTSTVVRLPQMPGKDLLTAAVFEARRTMIPAPGPQALFACQTVEDKPGDQASPEVLVVKTERQGLEERLALCRNAGILPRLITTSSVALLHTLPPRDRRNESLVMVNIGAETLDVVVAKRGMPRFFHNITLGCRQMSREIAGALRITDQEAERLLLTSGLPDPAAPAAAEGLDPRLAAAQPMMQSYLERTVTEIRRSLTFYRQESGERVNVIILSGGGALIPNLFPYLMQHLGGELRLCDPFSDLRHKDIPALEGAVDHGPLYATAYGLAWLMADPQQKRQAINFLPAEVRQRERRLVKTAVGFWIGLGLVISLGLGWLVTEARAATVRATLRRLQATYPSLESSLARQQHLTQRQQRLQTRRALIDELSKTQPAIPAILKGVVRALPERVILTELMMSGHPPGTATAHPASSQPGRDGARPAEAWQLLLKGVVQAHYEEAIHQLEELKTRLEQVPQLSEIIVTLPRVETLQPYSIGEDMVELTKLRAFAFTATATLR